MNYFLFKLTFQTGLHIGESEQAESLTTALPSFCADTLFSALCLTAKHTTGVERLNRLQQMASKGNILFSDAFPYYQNVLYLPKPLFPQAALSAKAAGEVLTVDQKKEKNIRYVPVSQYQQYWRSLDGKKFFPLESPPEFGINTTTDHVSMRIQEEALPYTVGVYYFHDTCGLYFILGYQQEDDALEVASLVSLLGMEGIGGKVSSGLGKFSCEQIPVDQNARGDIRAMATLLAAEKVSRHVLLTTSLPREDEMDKIVNTDSYYSLIRRGGFINSSSHVSAGNKKKTQYFLASGSITPRFEGDVYDVSLQGAHPAWRYGKPLFIGVAI